MGHSGIIVANLGGVEMVLVGRTEMRTFEEAIIDKFLLLSLIHFANEFGKLRPLKLQKLPFLCELEMNSKRIKGFNYCFFRYDYGPISKEIYKDRDILVWANLLTSEPHTLTRKGRQCLASGEELIRQNEIIIQHISETISEYGDIPPFELVNLIYEIELNPCSFPEETMKIRDIKRCWDIICKMEENESDIQFEIDEDWLDSLYLSFTTNEEEVNLSKKILDVPYKLEIDAAAF